MTDMNAELLRELRAIQPKYDPRFGKWVTLADSMLAEIIAALATAPQDATSKEPLNLAECAEAVLDGFLHDCQVGQMTMAESMRRQLKNLEDSLSEQDATSNAGIPYAAEMQFNHHTETVRGVMPVTSSAKGQTKAQRGADLLLGTAPRQPENCVKALEFYRRELRIIDFALYRFIGHAYHNAKIAASKGAGNPFKDGDYVKFLNDASDAETTRRKVTDALLAPRKGAEMTAPDIIEIAKKAKVWPIKFEDVPLVEVYHERILNFAALYREALIASGEVVEREKVEEAVKAEREECAKVCDAASGRNFVLIRDEITEDGKHKHGAKAAALMEAAATIRARSQP